MLLPVLSVCSIYIVDYSIKLSIAPCTYIERILYCSGDTCQDMQGNMKR